MEDDKLSDLFNRLALKEPQIIERGETEYIAEIPKENQEGVNEGELKDVIPESGKSIVLMLLKQVRPGMDLSRVVLPTFILEPRSMLEKLSDFLVHAELLALVPKTADPLDRILAMVKWYLSGFYIKPKGVKKPYNPILGEMFRCQWQSAESKTLFISEQVSHHPPISAFYCSNRKGGYIGAGSIHFRTTFNGLSAGSILDGFFTINVLPFDEEYKITFPSVYASGFIWGTLLMELAGNVIVECAKTGYSANLEFKQKPMFGGEYNAISGKVSQRDTVCFTMNGKWDSKIDITNVSTGRTEVLWEPTAEMRQNILPKQKPKDKEMYESDRLWQNVSKAIQDGDQNVATEEKAKLEHEQRVAAKYREKNNITWNPVLFEKQDNAWKYKYYNAQLWDPETEIEEVESNGKIYSKKKT